MPAKSFANLIISKLKSSISIDPYSYNKSTPMKANTAIAQGVTEYLLTNTKISISYKGIIPGVPPVPDPVVSDVIPITGVCAPPSGTDFDIWIKSLESNIVSGFFVFGPGTAGITPITPIPSFIVGLPLTKSSLTNIHVSDKDNAQQVVWEFICQKILDWLNATLNTGMPYAATNSKSGSTGTANILKTIVT